MASEVLLSVPPSAAGERLDKWLSEQETVALTRSALQHLFEEGQITKNGQQAPKNTRLRGGEAILVVLPEPEPSELIPEPIPLDIVYEDDDLLVVDKPQGMVVHPAPGHPTGTLVHALLYHCKGHLSGIGGVLRPGIVHRIDRDTSGLLAIAKNDAAHLKLSEQIVAHTFTREYKAVALGHFSQNSGTISAPIRRSATDRKKMCVTEKNAKPATTHYIVLEQYPKAAFLQLRLETGRTHQIRVHLSYKGHPVLGDTVYGKPYPGLVGQCLHAAKLGFVHPTTGEYLDFESELPAYFQAVLRNMRGREGGAT